MKIGIICHSGCGGSSKIAIELAKFLSRKHSVHVFTLYKSYFNDGLIKNKNLIFHTPIFLDTHKYNPGELKIIWSSNDEEQFFKKIIQVTTQEKLEILHFHYAIPFAKIMLQVKSFFGENSPVIICTLHGTDVTNGDQYKVELSKALPQFNLTTTVSSHYAKLAQESLSLVEKPLVIPNFVNFKEFNLKNIDISLKNKFKIIHVSNFRAVKNPLKMAKIFEQIRSKIPASLCLVGNGDQMAAVKAFLFEKGLESDVEYYDFQKKTVVFYCKADLLLMSSHAESFCLTALEAMALGIPVAAPLVGGLPELVINNKNGILYPYDDEKYAVEHIVNLLCNPAQLNSFRLCALEQARKFDIEKIAPKYEEVYHTFIINSHRGSQS